MIAPPDEQYLTDAIFFLTFGDQVPFKSAEEVLRLPATLRDALIRKLSDTYRQQKEEFEKAQKKGK